MNVYTHIGFDDVEEELKRTEKFVHAMGMLYNKGYEECVNFFGELGLKE